jgi:hypothetical protein
MPKRGSAVHLSTHRRHYVGKDGVERDDVTHLLRRSYRQDGKVMNETVANLSHLPGELIEMIRAALAGQGFVAAASAATVTRSRPHGHVAAVHAQAKALGPAGIVGPGGGSGTLRWPWSLPGYAGRPRSSPRPVGGPTRPWPPTWAWRTPPPSRCTRRWTGW